MPSSINWSLLSLLLLVGSSNATAPDTIARINVKFAAEGVAVEPFVYEEALDRIAELYLGVSKHSVKEPDFGEEVNLTCLVFSKGYDKTAEDLRADPLASPDIIELTERMRVDFAILRLLKTTDDAREHALNFLERNCTNFMPDAQTGRTHFGFAVMNNAAELRVVFLFANGTYSFKEVLSKLNPPPDLLLDGNVGHRLA